MSRGTRVGGTGRDGTDTDVNTSQASTSTEGTPVPIATEHARLKGLEVRSVGPGIDESRCRLESRPVDVEDGQAVRGVELHGARARVVRALVQRDQRPGNMHAVAVLVLGVARLQPLSVESEPHS